MNTLEQLRKLAIERNTPCVTISLNTHRTHPDNLQDEVKLKNFLNEAEERVIAEFGKRPVTSLLEKIKEVSTEIDVNYNLDSLHIFLSNDTKEIVKSAWSSSNEGVSISNNFAVRSIIKSYNRSESYLLMVLSQSGVQLHEALNDEITREIRNEDFPFPESTHFIGNDEKGSDPKHSDDLVREFLNKIDKALVKVHNETGLNCVVICTDDNYSRLQQVADNPSIYLGFSAMDYNKSTLHQNVKQSWGILQLLQKERRIRAIAELQEAVGQGNVLTDLQEIYQAAIDGRGELLIVHQDFIQPVLMTSDRTFNLINDGLAQGVIDDITSNIAWEVLSKKGRVFFTTQEELKILGDIVLKTRY